MLTIRELRAMRAHMTADAFARQLGPFVLIKKPDDAVESMRALQLGAGSTVMLPPKSRALDGMSLLFEFDELEVATLPPLEGNERLIVGRLPDSDLVVDHTSVSKRHAEVRWAQGRCTVLDLGSTNGTWVNDHPIADKACALNDTDIVAFGDVRFAFLQTPTLFRVMNAPPRHTPSTTPAVKPLLPPMNLPAAPPQLTAPAPAPQAAFKDTPPTGNRPAQPPRARPPEPARPPPVLTPSRNVPAVDPDQEETQLTFRRPAPDLEREPVTAPGYPGRAVRITPSAPMPVAGGGDSKKADSSATRIIRKKGGVESATTRIVRKKSVDSGATQIIRKKPRR